LVLIHCIIIVQVIFILKLKQQNITQSCQLNNIFCYYIYCFWSIHILLYTYLLIIFLNIYHKYLRNRPSLKVFISDEIPNGKYKNILVFKDNFFYILKCIIFNFNDRLVSNKFIVLLKHTQIILLKKVLRINIIEQNNVKKHSVHIY